MVNNGGGELVIIESNENLYFVFGDSWNKDVDSHDYSRKNCFVMENINTYCSLVCNIDYVNYQLWYDNNNPSPPTILPFTLRLQLTDFMRRVCDNRREYHSKITLSSSIKTSGGGGGGVLSSDIMTRFHIPNKNNMVNTNFNMYGSFQNEFLDLVDLVARIKIYRTEDLHTRNTLPQFYIHKDILTVVQLTKVNKTIFPDGGDDNDEYDDFGNSTSPPTYTFDTRKTYWGLLYHHKAIAMFRICIPQKCVVMTPIFDYDKFKIVDYVVY